MYTAFNTLQTQLESLIKRREVIKLNQSIHISDSRLPALDSAILDHEQAIKLIVSEHHKTRTLHKLVESVEKLSSFKPQVV